MRKKWTPGKIATLRALYPTTDTHEVAAAQGWRRPLMAWLLLQVQRAEAAGDTAAAEALRRRVRVVEQSAGLPR